jgi:hypothetical protein
MTQSNALTRLRSGAVGKAVCVVASIVSIVGIVTIRGQDLSAPRALDVRVPITYFIADGTAEAGYRASDRELALWALQAWQRSTGDAFRIEPAPESGAVVRVYWAAAQSGQYGEMLPLTVAGRRGAAVFIRPDIESLGPDIAAAARVDPLLRETIVYLTCLHELGHALGLMHTKDFRDIMYCFGYGGDVVTFFGRYRGQIHERKDIPAASGLSNADVMRIREVYKKAQQ